MIPAAVLSRIPGCEEGQPPSAVYRLPGGRGCNDVLRVDTRQGRFVWRNRQPPLDRPGSVARFELRSQQLAAAAGLAPQVLVADPGGHWLLMEFVEEPLWTEERLLGSAGIEQLGRRLAALHALAVPGDLPDLDAFGIAAGYLAQLRQRNAPVAASLEPLVFEVQRLSMQLLALGPRRCLNHGDLQVSNLLGDQPMLIDWEYAQITDPIYDLACLLGYYPAIEHCLDRLMGSAGLGRSEDLARLRLERQRFGLLNHLWDRVHTASAG